MRSFTTAVTVEWEDCDPAGIVFYPRFLSYFDRGSWNLWISVGLTREAIREMGAVGFPIMEAQAKFTVPCRFKDELRLVSTVGEIQERAIRVDHEIFKGDRSAVTGYEVRFLGMPHPTDPLRLRAGEIPQSVIDRLR